MVGERDLVAWFRRTRGAPRGELAHVARPRAMSKQLGTVFDPTDRRRGP
jgi:hypothetical protein